MSVRVGEGGEGGGGRKGGRTRETTERLVTPPGRCSGLSRSTATGPIVSNVRCHGAGLLTVVVQERDVQVDPPVRRHLQLAYPLVPPPPERPRIHERPLVVVQIEVLQYPDDELSTFPVASRDSGGLNRDAPRSRPSDNSSSHTAPKT